MKLGHIYLANVTWMSIVKMKLQPKLAYMIFKYVKQLAEEFSVIEQQRVALIHELTNTQENEEATIQPGTTEFFLYQQRFNEILSVDSNIASLDLSLEQFVNDINDNKLTGQELAQLEPFFSEPFFSG